MIEMILSIAKKVGISGHILLAICSHESGLKNVAVHNDGGSTSFGICQLKAETAKMVGFKGKSTDLMDSRVNILYSAKYLKYQKERYNGDWCKAIASYNSGTYKESEKYPGLPKNMKYVNHVRKKLSPKIRSVVYCDREKLNDGK